MVIDSTDKCTSRCGMQRHVLYGGMSLTYRRSPNDRVRLANTTIDSPASSRSFAWFHVSFCSNSSHEPMVQWPTRYQALVSIGNPQSQKKQGYLLEVGVFRCLHKPKLHRISSSIRPTGPSRIPIPLCAMHSETHSLSCAEPQLQNQHVGASACRRLCRSSPQSPMG
jgi:hypothetical protein